MKLAIKHLNSESFPEQLAQALQKENAALPEYRLGLLTSIDGTQVCALVMHPATGTAELWTAPVNGNSYKSLTSTLPLTHWYERQIFDLFGLVPNGHPRLKHLLLHEPYSDNFYPLKVQDLSLQGAEVLPREYNFLRVKGEGVYEIPVGPIHAGIIEPGHFRFSCFGETILNLELRLGYVHRGVEKRLTEVPWQKARFTAEAAATDTTVGNALAHTIAIESLLEFKPNEYVQSLRTLALEIERIAMHIIDIGGIATDIGLLGVASAMGRFRGRALGLGQALSGTRFMRGFIRPGGSPRVKGKSIELIRTNAKLLKQDLLPIVDMLLENQVARERMEGIGAISRSLGLEFGLVGIAARACGIRYDTRNHFSQGLYPALENNSALETGGDIFSRTKIRIAELYSSLDIVEMIASRLGNNDQAPLSGEPTAGANDSVAGVNDIAALLSATLPANSFACGVVEAFRGELIHLICTDEEGKIKRYAIKDPSMNNWTAISIAIRNNLIADFPLCNKSFGLSYSGNDL